MKGMSKIRGLQNIKKMQGTCPGNRNSSSSYLRLYMLRMEKQRMENEIDTINNRKKAVQEKLNDINQEEAKIQKIISKGNQEKTCSGKADDCGIVEEKN